MAGGPRVPVPSRTPRGPVRPVIWEIYTKRGQQFNKIPSGATGQCGPLLDYNPPPMKYRILGKTGLRVSVIGVGTWQFGGEWGKSFAQDEVTAMLRRAQELGVNLIDTAECYGDHLSESLIGGALQGNREQWIVATKFGHKFHG